MPNDNRKFGQVLNNNNGGRRAFATLNIQNKPILDSNRQATKQNIPTTNSNYNAANKENPLINQQVQISKSCSEFKSGKSFEIYDDGIFSQEKPENCCDEKMLDDNIEAVKKELDSFLIDSLEKSGSEFYDKENKADFTEDSLMIVDNEDSFKDSSQDDSILDSSSEISFLQQYSEFERFVDYSDSILEYVLEKERKHMPDPFYMNNQASVNNKMRSILVDWLVDVADEYKLKDETLFLTVNYIDRFLSKMSIQRQEFQLLGTSALFIASKYEEIYPPEIGEFVYITDDSFTKLQILQMEKLILTVLDFDISIPTSNYFLEKFLSDLQITNRELYCLSKYLCFLSMLESSPFLKYYPSEIALCSIILAAKTIGVFDLIPANFIRNSVKYERSLGDKSDVIQFLNDRNNLIEELNKLQMFASNHQQQAIQRKYSSTKYHGVSHLSQNQ